MLLALISRVRGVGGDWGGKKPRTFFFFGYTILFYFIFVEIQSPSLDIEEKEHDTIQDWS